jgi:transposase-like protein
MDGQFTLQQAVVHFADFENCKNFMVALRWPDGKVKCPRCGSERVVYLEKARVFKCYGKHESPKFSLKTGTIFEDSPIGLDKWLVAVWQIVNCRNGISSWELHRALGVTQKTAWFMLHRVRLAMQDDLTGGMMGGEIEVDETFIGGKVRNMHADRKRKTMSSGYGAGKIGNKTIVLGILERASEGKPKRVRTSIINDRKKASIMPEVAAHVSKDAKVYSDEHGEKWNIDGGFEMQVVKHLERYVDGQVHTNSLENFWSLLKRGVGGTYVAVEPFHLFRYVDEQAFRFNNRKDADGNVISDYERFKSALSQIVGKRLTYKELTGKEGQERETEAL